LLIVSLAIDVPARAIQPVLNSSALSHCEFAARSSGSGFSRCNASLLRFESGNFPVGQVLTANAVQDALLLTLLACVNASRAVASLTLRETVN